MRLALLAGVVAASLLAAGRAPSASTAVETRSCAQAGPFFNVQVVGNIRGTYWGRVHLDLFADVPVGKAIVAVWTFGSQQNIEGALYGWAAGSRSDIATRCRRSQATAPRGALGLPVRVNDGWAVGRRYECHGRGRIVIETRPVNGGTRLSVWMETSGELIAVAELKRGNATLRASKRCDENTG